MFVYRISKQIVELVLVIKIKVESTDTSRQKIKPSSPIEGLIPQRSRHIPLFPQESHDADHLADREAEGLLQVDAWTNGNNLVASFLPVLHRRDVAKMRGVFNMLAGEQREHICAGDALDVVNLLRHIDDRISHRDCVAVCPAAGLGLRLISLRAFRLEAYDAGSCHAVLRQEPQEVVERRRRLRVPRVLSDCWIAIGHQQILVSIELEGVIVGIGKSGRLGDLRFSDLPRSLPILSELCHIHEDCILQRNATLDRATI